MWDRALLLSALSIGPLAGFGCGPASSGEGATSTEADTGGSSSGAVTNVATDATASGTPNESSTTTTPGSSGSTAETTTASGGNTEESSTGGVPDPDWVYPEPDWDVETPEAHGMDSDLLDAADVIASDNDTGCLVVTRHGVIVHEWYAPDWNVNTKTDVFSVTKSVTSALVGIAQAEGLLFVDDSAADYIEPWATSEAAAVTIENLLMQESGRHWDFYGDYVQLDVIEGNKSGYAITREQQYAPGQWWEYNNTGVQALEPILRAATGQDVADWAQQHLLDRIGMDADFDHDFEGNTITYAHLQTSCRAAARLGYLYLRRGRWLDDQVIPAAWVDASTTPRSPLNDAYGYLWWLNSPGHWVRPSLPDRNEGGGLLLPNAPLGAYTARGVRAQLVAVEPARELVFTRLAPVPLQDIVASTQVEHDLWAAIMGAVIE